MGARVIPSVVGGFCLAKAAGSRSIFHMAWRIEGQVVRGEIDNRTQGLVTGRIWLLGRAEPIELRLEGNPWRDLAGHVLRFSNPDPKAVGPEGISAKQVGVVGDITASRKVKVLDCTDEEFREFYAAKTPFPWHWGNSLYLEWFSTVNGRVVIESAAYTLTLDGEPAWKMTVEEERAQRIANGDAMAKSMDLLTAALEAMEREKEDEQ